MKAKLKIIKKPWTGWSREQPPAKEEIITLEAGDSIEFISGMGAMPPKLESFGFDCVTIITSNLAPTKPGLGIDLRTDFTNLKTTIKQGETVYFVTQSMDAGNNFEITLLEID